jgi:hypothetical protein
MTRTQGCVCYWCVTGSRCRAVETLTAVACLVLGACCIAAAAVGQCMGGP